MKTKNTLSMTVQQLLAVQAHLGTLTTRWNPLVKNMLLGSRHGIHIFDLKKTLPHSRRMLYFLSAAAMNHQTILLVGSHPFVGAFVTFLAQGLKQFSLGRKWIAGTLSNWLRIRPYVRFLYRTNIGEIRRKFVLRTEKKIQQKVEQYLKMKHLFSGIERMAALPNCVILFDSSSATAGTIHYPKSESLALMIPTISIVSSGPSSPRGITYPFFANDHLFDTIFFYSNLLYQTLKAGVLRRRLLFLELLSSVEPAAGRTSTLEKVLWQRNGSTALRESLGHFHRSHGSFKRIALKRIARKAVYLFSLRGPSPAARPTSTRKVKPPKRVLPKKTRTTASLAKALLPPLERKTFNKRLNS